MTRTRTYAGMTVDLFKFRATSAAPRTATSRRFDGIIVVDVLVSQWDDNGDGLTYRSDVKAMESIRCHAYNPYRFGPMVLVKSVRFDDQWWELRDAKITDDEVLFTTEGMCSGAIADSSDSRWADITGSRPVRLYDRHDWEPTFRRPDGRIE